MERKKCRSMGIMKVLSRKWTLIILRDLSDNGRLRFSEILKKEKGLSSRTLSKRLKELEKLKIIKKEYFNEIPPRVEYSLAKEGKDLMKGLLCLDAWARKWKVVS